MSWTFTQEELDKHDEMIKEKIYKELMEHRVLMDDGCGGEYVVPLVEISDVLGQFEKDC